MINFLQTFNYNHNLLDKFYCRMSGVSISIFTSAPRKPSIKNKNGFDVPKTVRKLIPIENHGSAAGS